MKKLKIAFDYDGTLGVAMVKKLALLLHSSEEMALNQVELYIITHRQQMKRDMSDDVHHLEIPEDRIYFLGGERGGKARVINELGIDLYFEDMPDIFMDITMNCPNCICFLVGDEDNMVDFVNRNF